MSKHTPGPWRAAVSADFMPTRAESEVACVPHEIYDAIDVYGANGADSYEEHEANARLIAASPRLLTAAIEAMSAMDNIWQTKGREDDWIYDEMGSELSAGYFSLRAAIAEARGDA